MPSRTHRNLTPLTTNCSTTNWNNRSQSSINSDAAVFYSARAHPTPIELEQQIPRLFSSQPHSSTMSSPQEFRRTKMSRQDSGFAENVASIPSHVKTSSRPGSKSSSYHTRPSLNASRKSHSRPKDTSGTSSSASSATSRSTPKRSSKSQRASLSHSRPSLSSRHHHSQTLSSQPQYQFFHFPSLSDDLSQETPSPAANPPPPPPATIHYWTSDQTRRLEYAAIDAAGKGIRGFIARCIPDCFLPVDKRGTRFCAENMRGRDDDAGSVRRYRLVMEDEDENEMKGEKMEGKAEPTKTHRRRWSSFIRR
ncbi:bdf39ad0-15c1-4a8f-82c7-13343cd865be [Sclerotinia trifoliorum]|uniref:Bdf39ad0-15c1-4a8f-82c7-13343cd865be n=1 Tax=Sclerotinia trifoliorum TaxID=28548 RepID=A0A8H2W1W5_9HELO|nr:bdf39ad0-15c1-4a8f-82c7-13343cd865be [Sclerotinia trifoliorum]